MTCGSSSENDRMPWICSLLMVLISRWLWRLYGWGVWLRGGVVNERGHRRRGRVAGRAAVATPVGRRRRRTARTGFGPTRRGAPSVPLYLSQGQAQSTGLSVLLLSGSSQVRTYGM